MPLEDRVKPHNERGWLSSPNNRKQLSKCQSHNYYVDVRVLLHSSVRYMFRFIALCFVHVFV